LLSQWIGTQPTRAPGDSLAALAEQYFSSHGPASVQDFAWRSGLPVSAARQALEATPSLVQVKAEDKLLWAGQEPLPVSVPQTAYLLPPYDAYLLGYKDRSWILDQAYARRVNAGGGMPKPTIVVNGRVVGTWQRMVKGPRTIVKPEPFRRLEEAEITAIEDAAGLYGQFNSSTVEIQWQSPTLS
jgi:hypothetical protein